MSVILNFDSSKLRFDGPHTVRGSQMSFQYQSLSYDGQPCLLQTKPFIASGLTKSKFQDQPQMFIPSSSIPVLIDIDEIAKKALIFPEDAPSSWKEAFDSGEAYKSLNIDKLYLKTKNLIIYDTEGDQYDGELKQGTYSAILHVVGIYIGSHGTTTKRASLQVKVKQLQYEPLADKCLFVKPTELMQSNKHSATGQLTFKQPLAKRRKVSNLEPLIINNDGTFDGVDKKFITKCEDAAYLWKFYLYCQKMITKSQSGDKGETAQLVESTEKQLKSLLGDDWLMQCRNQ